jgi:hypothetical protein
MCTESKLNLERQRALKRAEWWGVEVSFCLINGVDPVRMEKELTIWKRVKILYRKARKKLGGR